MNKFIVTVFLLVLSTAIFADDQLNAAIHEAKAAEILGQQGKVTKLIRHANMALVHSLAASNVAKGTYKTELDAASNSLKNAINDARLNYVGPATKSVELAVQQLEAAKKL